ncbi:MAG: response regulator [Deltaproteobacteria bacterium]|nr:response regulator [Deltaproteobacteria bacterium]
MPSGKPAAGAGPRVLVVDDEQEFAAALAKRLGLRGFDVEVAHDGEQALARIRATAFDAVVLDIRMPGPDGVATLRQVRLERPGLSVILLTGHVLVSQAIEGMRLGAFDYLTKPVDTDRLTEVLRTACGSSPTR